MTFRRPLTVSVLTERRALQPWGMAGGQPGERGVNLLHIHSEKRTVSLGGKNTVHVKPGDCLTILTPGGGGYGAVTEKGGRGGEMEEEEDPARKNRREAELKLMGSVMAYQLGQEQA
ncbi:unnamed protein product [Discosporangium mesarthrocarpum]